jgi:hypothetical protein
VIAADIAGRHGGRLEARERGGRSRLVVMLPSEHE